jgi:hypothetical protein
MTRPDVLPLNEPLLAQSRPGSLAASGRVGVLEVLTLIAMGAVAAGLTTFVDLHLRIPGHHILFAVFPMALGFALVPRRRAGTLMGLSALAFTGGFNLLGAHPGGVGALTSLLATGPLLDLALRWGQRGVRLYGAFLVGGAASNALAFVVRGTAKALAIGGVAGTRAFGNWWPQAIATYTLAGLLAGLISAGAWFHLRRRG